MFLYTCNMLLYTCIYIYIHVYTCVYVSQESLPSDTKHDVEVFLSTVTDDNSLQSILWYSATHCNTLQHTATCRHILQHAATHRGTSSVDRYGSTSYLSYCPLQHTATHCNTLQHTATPKDNVAEVQNDTARHCKTLQDTATHCKTLQRTATHNHAHMYTQ